MNLYQFVACRNFVAALNPFNWDAVRKSQKIADGHVQSEMEEGRGDGERKRIWSSCDEVKIHIHIGLCIGSLMKWSDKRDVLLLLTKHTDIMTSTGRPSINRGNVSEPQAVLHHNAAKQGFDVSDQLYSIVYYICLSA